MSLRRVFISVSLVIGLAALCVGLFYRDLVSYGVETWFRVQGLEVDFKIVRLNFTELKIEDLQIEDSLLIPSVEISYKLKGLSLDRLRALRLRVSQIDLAKVSSIVSKMTAAFPADESQAKESLFASLTKTCQSYASAAFDIKIDQINWQKRAVLHQLQMIKGANNSFILTVEDAKALGVINDFRQQLTVACGDEHIQARLLSGRLNLKPVASAISPSLFMSASAHWSEWTFDLGVDNALAMSGQLGLDLQGLSVGGIKSLRIPKARLEANIKTDEEKEGEVSVKAEKVFVETDYKFSIGSLYVSSKVPWPELTDLDFSVRDMNVDLSAPVGELRGLSSLGKIRVSKKKTQASMSLWDKTKSLSAGEILVDYVSEEDQLELSFGKKGLSLKLSDKLKSLLPNHADVLTNTKGHVRVHAKIRDQREKLSAHLKFRGDKISFTFEELHVEGLDVQQDLFYPQMKSSRGQSLKIERVNYDKEALTQFNIKYKMNSRSKWQFDGLDFVFHEGEFKTTSFDVDLEKKQIHGLGLEVKGYRLEHLLGVALGDKVQADGTVVGRLALDYFDKKIKMHGHFESEKPGRIKYRPRGEDPNANHFSLSPMDILQSYLYDFYYTNLGLSVVVQEDFNMQMILSTLGRNPGYLGGKPLKLNINLKQNLLAALKGMMLSYDLSEVLKQKLEESNRRD